MRRTLTLLVAGVILTGCGDHRQTLTGQYDRLSDCFYRSAATTERGIKKIDSPKQRTSKISLEADQGRGWLVTFAQTGEERTQFDIDGSRTANSNRARLAELARDCEQLPTFVQEARLEASDAWGSFGYHLDFSANGNVLAVGAYESAYVFTRSAGTWTRQARLESGAGGGEYFGIVVGLSATGTTLAVGAHLADFDRTGNAGKVYVFTYAEGRWVRQAELHAGDVTEQSHFGVLALSPDGDTLAVGAYSADYTRQRAGKVFIFQRSDGVWTQRAILQPKEAAPGDCFGINLAMSADAKVLGVAAYCATTAGVSGAGAVYVFSRTGDVWTEEVRLESAAPAVQANAGVRISLSADGNTLAVGEYHANNSGGPRAGNAYVFTRAHGAWTRQSLLQASDASPDASFGCSVSLSGDGNTLIVGAYGSDHEAGRAYVFTRTRNSWFERAQLRADDTVAGDNFGIRVAMTPDGATLGIGAYLANNRAGKVYTFVRERLKN